MITADLDTRWAEMWAWLATLPDDDPDKHEMLAHVWMTCARSAWRRADHCRAVAARRSARG